MTSGYEPLPGARSLSLRVAPGVAAIFRKAREGMPRAEGRVSSILDYIDYLEEGTRRMAARPVIGPHVAEYREWVHEELLAALARHPGDFEKATAEGISMATLRIMRAMADRTAQPAGAYFTGRAKGSWTAHLPGGRAVASGPVITAEQQKARIKNRRAEARKKQKGTP